VIRAHFVNENIGGHRTMHLEIRRALADRGDVDASFFDVPPPTLLRRVLAAPLPGLAAFDADLHPLRDQLTKSAVVRSHLRRLDAGTDVLHVYTHNAALLSAGLLRRVPSVVSLDATNEQNAFRLPQRHPTRFTKTALVPTKYLERRVYEAATLVIAKSEWAAASLRGYGVEADRLRIVPFGVHVPDGISSGSPDLPRLLFVGRSMDRKGGWLVLDAWRNQFRDRATLTLVTEEPVPEEPGLEVRRDIRPGDGRLHELLLQTDLLVFPTRLDTFGYAALEAMAAGVPVVAFRTAAMPEIVDDGVTGVLADPGDDDALSAAIGRLLGDPASRQAMGAAARRRVLDRFDARTTTAAFVEILVEAIDRGPRRRRTVTYR
jgi:alpha-maltose-1-phosphate synthase